MHGFVLAVLPSQAVHSWFSGPFTTKGRWMTNAEGNNLSYAGVNWPGHGDAMIPEGLQYASIRDIVTKIKSIGMNTVRLTWAVQMVDDIYNIQDGRYNEVRASLNNALGVENGTIVFDAVRRHNPSFAPNITRLQVFDAIAAECAEQQVYVHLDNHVSKAGWCCNMDDGNGWFNDEHFDVERWMRALGFMAEHGKSWRNLVSIGLRNELRESKHWMDGYSWSEWYDSMTAAASAVHKANPDLLIFFSGMDYDTKLNPIFTGKPMGEGGRVFDKDKLEYGNKIVLEVHDYDARTTDCSQKLKKLRADSFGALDLSNSGTTTEFPLVMSEWGFDQFPNRITEPYASCLREILPEHGVGWMTWVLGGSYYIRSGIQDHDETWGLLDHEWNEWRCPECITQGLEPMIQGTLAGKK
ncbi:MAG: hypothetical protein Q9216_003678 [Gyalolechia sp. 2 TL-2023]